MQYNITLTKRHTMAGTAKSVYLTINKKGSTKTEFTKVFFAAKSIHDEYIKIGKQASA